MDGGWITESCLLYALAILVHNVPSYANDATDTGAVGVRVLGYIGKTLIGAD